MPSLVTLHPLFTCYVQKYLFPDIASFTFPPNFSSLNPVSARLFKRYASLRQVSNLDQRIIIFNVEQFLGGKLVTTRETSNRSRSDLQILQAHSLPSCGDQWHYSRSDRPSSDCPPDLQIQRWNKSALAVCLFDSQRPIKDKDGVPGRTTSVAKREGEEEVVEEEGAFSLSLFESEASNSIRHRCQISYVTSSSSSSSSSNVFSVELEHDSNSRTGV